MIYEFRKEMKKWKSVLWVVLASLAITGGIGIFSSRRGGPGDISVAVVNGQSISMSTYRQSLNEINMQIDMYRTYAKMYNIPVEMFLSMSGLDNPAKSAFDKCVNDSLWDQAKNKFSIQLDPKYFESELGKMLPMQVKDPQGNLDLNAYKFYLNRLGFTIGDFEKNCEENLERSIFQNFVKQAYYVPTACAKELFAGQYLKKKFNILEIPFDKFVKEVRAQEPTKEELKSFYEKHKESYRVPERKKTAYWIVSPEKYAERMVIDDEVVQNFYEKNKGSLFRIPPKAKIRHIFLKIDSKGGAKELEKTLEKAKSVYDQVTKNPEKFEDLVKKYSQHKDSKDGGLIDYFDKGTYELEFENAALKLQEKGEISQLVKTKDGYEIIQLVERKASSEKSLESVQNEIIKTLKSKKSLIELKSNLEKVLHDARKNEEAFNTFAQDNGLKTEETAFLTAQDTAGEKLENILAQKIFASGKKSNVQGYFPFAKNQILYKLLVNQPSYTPDFESVESRVLQDYYKDKAKNKIKSFVKDMQRKLLSASVSMEELAKQQGLKFMQTEMLKKYDEAKNLKISKDLIQKAFVLDDLKEVLKAKEESNYYLIMLTGFEKIEDKTFETLKAELLSKEKTLLTNQYLESFIASLWRNAKIEKVEKMLNVNFSEQQLPQEDLI